MTRRVAPAIANLEGARVRLGVSPKRVLASFATIRAIRVSPLPAPFKSYLDWVRLGLTGLDQGTSGTLPIRGQIFCSLRLLLLNSGFHLSSLIRVDLCPSVVELLKPL
jgi:hypothetical protein